jgi:hypothetical protein
MPKTDSLQGSVAGVANDWAMVAIPALTILLAASLAALPAVIRAVRIDPVSMLRAE